MESTSNSVMVEGLVPSDDQYCVVVTAIDIKHNSGNGSDPVCFTFTGINILFIIICYNITFILLYSTFLCQCQSM